MKRFADYITEKLKLRNTIIYKYFPKTNDELCKLVRYLIKERGPDADLNDIDTSEITDMSEVFRGTDVRRINISAWDVSNVTKTYRMFSSCLKLEEIDLSTWDTSKLRYANYMFFGDSNFNANLENWNLSSLFNASYMFFNCKKFNCNVSKWDVRSVVHMDGMFSECNKFNGNPGTWDVSNCMYFENMFYGNKALRCNFNNWKVNEKANIDGMFTGCKDKTIPDWYFKYTDDSES